MTKLSKFYDGTRLLSLKDLRGEVPEIYMCSTNRSGGKTTFFTRLCVRKFLKTGSKSMYLYRYESELSDACDKLFKEVNQLFFHGHTFTAESRAKGAYLELFTDGQPSGYVCALNTSEKLKRMSHLFADTDRIFFDEFQSEYNHYCTDEVKKFQSLHTTVARGGGKSVRYVPVIMCSNFVTMLNPYYSAMGVSSRLKSDTKFLRGNGWVLEQGIVESARQAFMESAFNRAFAESDYNKYASELVYLNDDECMVEKLRGKSRYILTFKQGGNKYSMKEKLETGHIYVTKQIDHSFPRKICTDVKDVDTSFTLISKADVIIQTLRQCFSGGSFRFNDFECKDATIKLLSY